MFLELDLLAVCMFWNRLSFWNEKEHISGMLEMNNREAVVEQQSPL